MLHCNGIDPFVTLMCSFNWGPISRNDIVSRFKHDIDVRDHCLLRGLQYHYHYIDYIFFQIRYFIQMFFCKRASEFKSNCYE